MGKITISFLIISAIFSLKCNNINAQDLYLELNTIDSDTNYNLSFNDFIIHNDVFYALANVSINNSNICIPRFTIKKFGKTFLYNLPFILNQDTLSKFLKDKNDSVFSENYFEKIFANDSSVFLISYKKDLLYQIKNNIIRNIPFNKISGTQNIYDCFADNKGNIFFLSSIDNHNPRIFTLNIDGSLLPINMSINDNEEIDKCFINGDNLYVIYHSSKNSKSYKYYVNIYHNGNFFKKIFLFNKEKQIQLAAFYYAENIYIFSSDNVLYTLEINSDKLKSEEIGCDKSKCACVENLIFNNNLYITNCNRILRINLETNSCETIFEASGQFPFGKLKVYKNKLIFGSLYECYRKSAFPINFCEL